MLTATSEQLDLLEELDFQPACEHERHHQEHPAPDEPAGLFVRARCPQCSDTVDYLLCKSGFVQMGRNVIGCECGWVGYRGEAITILQVL